MNKESMEKYPKEIFIKRSTLIDDYCKKTNSTYSCNMYISVNPWFGGSIDFGEKYVHRSQIKEKDEKIKELLASKLACRNLELRTKDEKMLKSLEEIVNGHLCEKVSKMIARKCLKGVA